VCTQQEQLNAIKKEKLKHFLLNTRLYSTVHLANGVEVQSNCS
jgi:hypothetical protein